MIPDGFQYFLDDLWNFQNFSQIWTRGPRIHHQNASKNARNDGIILTEYCFFISRHFGNPTFPALLTLSDITNVEPIFSFFNMVGPKQLASPSVFKDFSVVES